MNSCLAHANFGSLHTTYLYLHSVWTACMKYMMKISGPEVQLVLCPWHKPHQKHEKAPFLQIFFVGKGKNARWKQTFPRCSACLITAVSSHFRLATCSEPYKGHFAGQACSSSAIRAKKLLVVFNERRCLTLYNQWKSKQIRLAFRKF